VGQVSDGAELFHTIECLRPDIVVLDLNMPGIDGLDACRQIKAAAPDLDVIVCTAANDSSLRARALEAGASALVMKFRVGSELLAAIQRTRSICAESGQLVVTRSDLCSRACRWTN
jgi:two-component system response regulator DesR